MINKECTACFTVKAIQCFRPRKGRYRLDGTQIYTSHCITCLNLAQVYHRERRSKLSSGTSAKIKKEIPTTPAQNKKIKKIEKFILESKASLEKLEKESRQNLIDNLIKGT